MNRGMNKIVKAIEPYVYPKGVNFKHNAFKAWKEIGGLTAPSRYPPKQLHRFAFNYELPALYKKKKEARLRFVQPWTIKFDTFPDYTMYEIIPFVWDIWPGNVELTISWLKKHQVKTAIFTSSQAADIIKKRIPSMNVLTISEGIKTDEFCEGKLLKDRNIDFLEYGRNIDRVVKYEFGNLHIIRGQKDGKNLLSQNELNVFLQNSKIVAAYPKNWTDPEKAGNIETLTQRYWECMLSRCLMIGHAPHELNKLIGYNPVIEIDKANPDNQLYSLLENIGQYQNLVDRNRDSALKYGDWKVRMIQLRAWLSSIGYDS